MGNYAVDLLEWRGLMTFFFKYVLVILAQIIIIMTITMNKGRGLRILEYAFMVPPTWRFTAPEKGRSH